MNTDQWINLVQTLFKVGGGALAAKGCGDSSLWEAASGFTVALLTWYLSHKWNSTPAQSQPLSVPITKIAPLVALAAGLFWFVGCAPLHPGADPLVVRCEQTESMAKDSFDGVLGIDNSNRAFYQTNAPAFHDFCEWLRQPQMVEGTNTLPRCSAMIISLDDVKLAYKSARASSNDVSTAMQTVLAAVAQANTWISSGTTNATPQTK